jgi:hypothetical protein
LATADATNRIPALLGLQDQRENQAITANPDRTARRASLDQSGWSHRGLTFQPVARARCAQRERKDPLVVQGSQEELGPRDNREAKETTASREHQEPLDHRDQQERKAQPANQERKDHPAATRRKARRVHQESLAKREAPELQVHQARKAPLPNPDLRDPVDPADPQAQVASLERKDPLDRLENQENQVQTPTTAPAPNARPRKPRLRKRRRKPNPIQLTLLIQYNVYDSSRFHSVSSNISTWFFFSYEALPFLLILFIQQSGLLQK